MKVIAASFTVWYVVFGMAVEANIIDDLILNNWRDKGPVMKESDPFYNPFGLSFPLFGEMSAEEPAPDMRMTMNDNFNGGKDDVKRTTAERSHGKRKPWFSISEFLTLPEMSRKRKAEGRKPEAVPGQDKMTQTGDLTQTKMPAEGSNRTVNPFDHDKELVIEDGAVKNFSKSKIPNRGSGSSFPKGLSDILIIFQKVGPKPKAQQMTSPSFHNCEGINCHDGICEIRQPEVVIEEPREKRGLLDHFDRLFLLVIPIVLGIGTVFFVMELRRIYKKMKKQAIISTLEHQEC